MATPLHTVISTHDFATRPQALKSRLSKPKQPISTLNYDIWGFPHGNPIPSFCFKNKFGVHFDSLSQYFLYLKVYKFWYVSVCIHVHTLLESL